MTRSYLPGILAMAAVVVASNILVQFLCGQWLTWGACTYPVAFLVTDVMNRVYGVTAARKVVVAGFIVGVICSLIGTQIMGECAQYMTRLWNERVNQAPGNDLIAMMAHSDATRNMTPEEFLGNVMLLIVGGNDTTRNSMTGSIVALNQYPDEYRKLCANQALMTSMIPEVIDVISAWLALMTSLHQKRSTTRCSAR